MKICPQCTFANEERFPACLWCNAVLVNVRSTPAADPDHPEHARLARDRQRHARLHRQLLFAVVLYGVAATLLAVMPGMVRDPAALLVHFTVALLVAAAVTWRVAGSLTGMLLHGALSMAVVYFFGPIHVFVFFMILGHILLPNLFWHWTEMIESSLR